MKTQTYRMKDACTRTGLTERTIRFYIEKGLLTPQQEEMNGRTLTFFDEEDLARLEEVSLLRKAGFSIDSIVTMTKYPQTIDDLLREQMTTTEKNVLDSQAVLKHLRNAAGQHYQDVHQLYDALNCEPIRTLAVNSAISEPNYSRFETATEQERLDGYVRHIITRQRQDRKEVILLWAKRILIAAACIVLLFSIIAGGYIPRPIHKTLVCHQYDSSTGEIICDVEVTIRGGFHTPLFRNAYFVGDISIEQLSDMPKDQQISNFGAKFGYDMEAITFTGENEQVGQLIYRVANGLEKSYTLGRFRLLRNDFSDFEILLFMPMIFDGSGHSTGTTEVVIRADTQ